MLWRVIEDEVVPTCRELGISQIVWSPIAQGVLTGKYVAGQPHPAGSRATDENGGAGFVARWWERWRVPVEQMGGRADEWRFRIDLPAIVSKLDHAAKLDHRELTARSLWVGHGQD